MAVLNDAPYPFGDRVVNSRREGYSDERPDPQEGLMAKAWADSFSHDSALKETFPSRVHTAELSDQAASIGATDMTDGTLTAGLYSLTYYLRVTTVNNPGATVQLTLDWSDGTTTRTYTGASVAMTAVGNYETGIDNAPHLIRIGALTPVRYTVTLTNGGTGEQYALDLCLMEVKA